MWAHAILSHAWEKTASGFFGEENMPGLPIKLSLACKGRMGMCQKQRSKAGAFLVPDEQLSLTPI